MKIGITCHPTHGGSGVIASELALALAERGHELHIVSYATPFRLRSYYENVFIHEVEVSSYPLFRYPPYALALAAKLVEVAKDYDLQLIHAHYAVPHATSAYLAKQMLRCRRLKTITTLHGTDITLVGLEKSYFEVIKFNIEESDAVTAVSRYLEQRTRQEFDIGREIRVIPNFVDTGRFRRDEGKCVRERFAAPGEKILLHTSNFREVKRVPDVVRVFARVRQSLPARLLLIGDGPERLPAQQLARELGVSREVTFLGELDYIEGIMNCADLFLLPSEQESFGLSALEALACGVPVIASDAGGLPEVLVDGQTGYLLPVGDVQAMAERAVELLTDPELFGRMREQCRQRALEFHREKIVPQYEALYRELVEGG